NDLVITDKATSQTVTVEGQFHPTGSGRLEQLELADGTTWTADQIYFLAATGATSVAGGPQFGTAGGDLLTGTSLAEFIFAGAGDDTVNGGDGGDRLYGEADSDILNGEAGADTLEGGSG